MILCQRIFHPTKIMLSSAIKIAQYHYGMLRFALKLPNLRYICGTVKKKNYGAVQLNQYETAPNFIQLNQNLTSDC